MPIPLGIFATAGAGGTGTTYELISSTILGSTTLTVSFSSIPSTYKHLQLRFTARNSNNVSDAWMRFNSDSGSNYAGHRLSANGSNVASSSETSQSRIFIGGIANNNEATDGFSGGTIDMLDFANTSENKTVRILSGYSTTIVYLRSGVWLNTSAISSVDFISGASGFLAGSRFSLYGIKG